MAHPMDVKIAAEVRHLPTVEFTKKTYSLFGRYDITSLLLRSRSNTIVVCGIGTDTCVLNAGIGLFDRGYHPVVISDFCASNGGEEISNQAIAILRRNIGSNNVLTVSDYVCVTQ